MRENQMKVWRATHDRVLGLLTRQKQTVLHRKDVSSPSSRQTADSCGKTRVKAIKGKTATKLKLFSVKYSLTTQPMLISLSF